MGDGIGLSKPWLLTYAISTKISYTVDSEIFARDLFSRNFAYFVKNKNPCQIILSFTDIGKSCPSREFITLQICLSTLFAKIKLSQKFLNLQYWPVCLSVLYGQKKFHFLSKDMVWVLKSCLCEYLQHIS